MATRPSIHINTVRKRKRAEIGKELVILAKDFNATGKVAAYALIVFNDDGKAICRFDTGGLMPLWAFPGAVEFVTRDSIDVDEDYNRPVKSTLWPQVKNEPDNNS